MWKCRTCETKNYDNLCIICGDEKPPAEAIVSPEKKATPEKKAVGGGIYKTTKPPIKENIVYTESETSGGLMKFFFGITILLCVLVTAFLVYVLYNGYVY